MIATKVVTTSSASQTVDRKEISKALEVKEILLPREGIVHVAAKGSKEAVSMRAE